MIHPVFQENPIPRFTGQLELTGPYLIATDFHAPLQSTLWCNRLITLRDMYNVRRVILGGDTFNFDAFSSWCDEEDLTWPEEMTWAADWLWTMYHAFDEIVWVRGNHCQRLTRATNGKLRASDLIDSILCNHARYIGQEFLFNPKRLRFTDYPYLYLDDDWMVIHPSNHSVYTVAVANELAVKHQRHIIASHSHRAGTGWSKCGRYVLIDSGGMGDWMKIRHMAFDAGKAPRWANGCVVYTGGYAQLFSDEPYTCWKAIEHEAA